ncbi:DUF1707 SHOCT-like domain-containing protein [Rhodococcus sp. 24CO]|uniref:DUF1707 SHOCT-like domain-containing protein n=1 Tax=Rhodococcus sp. 24CO TaxID=3117460 RepID=UPI003D354ED3
MSDYTPTRRATDTERLDATLHLTDALTRGALDGEEYNDRIELVNSARSIDQVTATLVDLPPLLPASTASEERKRDDLREWLNEWQYWLGGSVLMVGIWGVQSFMDGSAIKFWPGVPIGIWAVVLIACVFWPSDDHESS